MAQEPSQAQKQKKPVDPVTLRNSSKLSLKGGVPWGVSKKKKKKVPKDLALDTEAEIPQILGVDGKPIDPKSVSVQSGKTYEQEFSLQMEKAKSGKVKNTPWGSSFRAPQEVLHGYSAPVKGANAEERLDLRCAIKTDKFCK